MFYLHIEIKDEKDHSAESVVLAKCLLQTQYEVLHHRLTLVDLCRLLKQIDQKAGLNTMMLPSGPMRTKQHPIDELRDFAATNLPGFSINLSERNAPEPAADSPSES